MNTPISLKAYKELVKKQLDRICPDINFYLDLTYWKNDFLEIEIVIIDTLSNDNEDNFDRHGELQCYIDENTSLDSDPTVRLQELKKSIDKMLKSSDELEITIKAL